MDKNFAFNDEGSEKLLNELPEYVQVGILRDYMFKDFLAHFRRTFSIPCKESPHLYAFYTWDNNAYKGFMICVLRALEPRKEERNVVLMHELDEVLEIFFFNKGIVEIGFEINHIKHFVLR